MPHCHGGADRLLCFSMLKNTFIHVPGIGPQTEASFWKQGVWDWEDFFDDTALRLPEARRDVIAEALNESRRQLKAGNPAFFADRMPASQHWRLFAELRTRVVYLDIETTGLDDTCSISTIALYDGSTMATYVHGTNLNDFINDIQRYDLLVTYNGKCFDVPFIERAFGQRLDHAHIDLRYVLAGLGLKGGLKRCEIQMGLDRGALEDVDGIFAVVLWNGYLRNRDEQALETLLAYNLQDVINLELLMVSAYNTKVAHTPFGQSHFLPLPAVPENPIPIHRRTLDRYRREAAFIRSLQPQH